MPESPTNLETCDRCGNVHHRQWECPVCHEPNTSLPDDPGSTPGDPSWTPIIIIIIASIIGYVVIRGTANMGFTWLEQWVLGVVVMLGIVFAGIGIESVIKRWQS